MAERRETGSEAFVGGFPEPLQGFSKSPGSGLIAASRSPRVPGIGRQPKAVKVPKIKAPKALSGGKIKI